MDRTLIAVQNYDIYGYLKNSMNRFGDDLTEEVLQYLSFEEEIRLECVSKQWQRCVFGKQYVIGIIDPESYNSNYFEREKKNIFLVIDTKRFNFMALESLLKKCSNIQKVVLGIDVDSEVLSLIGQYCNYIKSLEYKKIYPSIRGFKTLDFYRMYGYKLEELIITERDEGIKYYLKYCVNLKTVSILEESLLYNERKEFLPKLEKLETTFLIPSILLNGQFGSLNQTIILNNKYSQSMKSLNAFLYSLTDKELKTCIECISRFENLNELKLRIDSLRITEPIDDCLSLIGQKCNNLLKLELEISPTVPITDRVFASFSDFKTIKKLRIDFSNDITFKASNKAFKHCKELKELDISYNELTEDFFANIELFVPKLQKLQVLTRKQISESFIDSFHSMKNIQRIFISICNFDDNLYRIHKKYWYFGKSLIEVMLSPNGMNVKHINDNCGLIIDEVITDIDSDSDMDSDYDIDIITI